jgi:CRISPR system Cascade subunit CasB
MTEAEVARAERSLAATINHLAGLLAHGGGVLTSGDVAEMRRMDPRTIDAPGFYKLAGAVLEQDLPRGGAPRTEAETRWAAIIVGLAHLGARHRPDVRLGEGLVAAGFSELRFARLLRADSERLLDELPALARFLAAKNTSADFTAAAYLMLSAGRSDEESARRSLARDYYGALARRKNDSK